jgi:hypothetical protein
MKSNMLRPLSCVVLAGTSVALASIGFAAEPAKETGKYILFMGADLAVQQGKKFYTVEDVDGSEFVIQIKGEKKFIRTRMAANTLKVEHELKIAPFSVQLDDLQGAAGYTPGADPRHKFNARSGAAGGAAAARDLADFNSAEARTGLENLKKDPRGPDPARKAAFERTIETEDMNSATSNFQLSSDYSSIGTMANGLALELAEGNFDMIDVSFKISSPEVLDDPYMVVLVEFQLRDAKPGQTSQLIHAKALDPIGPTPKYIRVREGGMPVGFKYLRHEVRIYNRGREVATNASSKRVELSRDEAREYLLFEHLSAHKDATVPPAPVAGSLPRSARDRLNPEQLNRVCYARIAKDGRLLGVFVDEGASLPLTDPVIAETCADALFKPALAQGKPMDGVVRFRLAELTL